jgi:hypothetical protein
MHFYDEHILPHLINLACSNKPTQKQRAKIVPLAAGDVLEIGFGSGLNLPFYDSSKVRKIWGLEPSAGMRKKMSNSSTCRAKKFHWKRIVSTRSWLLTRYARYRMLLRPCRACAGF